jgi:hypothetical protein
MGYAIKLSPKAANRLATVPRSRLGDVASELERLALNPRKLGRKTVSPPFPVTIEHVYGFHFRHEEETHYLTVFFLYSDDDTFLYITDITINPAFSVLDRD